MTETLQTASLFAAIYERQKHQIKHQTFSQHWFKKKTITCNAKQNGYNSNNTTKPQEKMSIQGGVTNLT